MGEYRTEASVRRPVQLGLRPGDSGGGLGAGSQQPGRTDGRSGRETRHAVERRGVLPFLEDLRSSLKDGSFQPLPVREATIPKKGGKVRRWGIPTLRDRVARMALKLVLEPVFEAGF